MQQPFKLQDEAFVFKVMGLYGKEQTVRTQAAKPLLPMKVSPKVHKKGASSMNTRLGYARWCPHGF